MSVTHINQLAEQLQKYFPTYSMDTSRTWICNPFEASVPVPQLSFQEQLTDLSSDGAPQLRFKQKPLVNFCIKAMTAYPVLAKQTLKVLKPLATTYLCEAAFSALTPVKTRYCQRLDAVEKNFRLKLYSIVPNMRRCRPTRCIWVGTVWPLVLLLLLWRLLLLCLLTHLSLTLSLSLCQAEPPVLRLKILKWITFLSIMSVSEPMHVSFSLFFRWQIIVSCNLIQIVVISLIDFVTNVLIIVTVMLCMVNFNVNLMQFFLNVCVCPCPHPSIFAL